MKAWTTLKVGVTRHSDRPTCTTVSQCRKFQLLLTNNAGHGPVLTVYGIGLVGRETWGNFDYKQVG